jgi:hypothetical protein
METFDFKFYSVVPGAYPAGDTVQLGKGHQVGVKPLLPIQRTHVLEFSSLQWIKDSGGVIVSDIRPTENMLALIEFYEAHMMWRRFTFPHEIYGDMEVRFKDPLVPPKAITGGSGWTQPFEITLIEQPA